MNKLSDWYYVDKDQLEKYDVSNIKTDLIERARDFKGFSYGEKDSIIMYRDIGNYLKVPRYYGIKTFGEPYELNLSEGWDIDINFNGELHEDKNQISLTSEFLEKLGDTRGGLLCSGCGTGKTVMFLYILSQIKKHTMILVHKEFIMQQWIDRIDQFLEGNFTVGIVQQDKCEYQEDIVIGMMQSIHSRDYPERMFKSFGVVCADECHHLAAKTYFDVATKFNPYYICGASATPKRGDGLENVFLKHVGPILCKNTDMDVGGLVYQIGINAELSDKMFKMRNGNFNLARWISKIARIKERTKIIAKHAMKLENTGRKVMVLTHRLAHVDSIIDEISFIGGEAGKCVGGMTAEDVFETFDKYGITVGTYQFISEAVDIPELNGLILATPKSNIEQAIGRLTRTTVEKKRPIVTELVDTWSYRGRGYANKHLKIYDRLGFEVK